MLLWLHSLGLSRKQVQRTGYQGKVCGRSCLRVRGVASCAEDCHRHTQSWSCCIYHVSELACVCKISFLGLNPPLTILFRTEVLHYTGVMEDIPGLSDEQEDMLKVMKNNVVKKANGFRASVRRRLSPEAVQYVFDKELVGALGLASGAFVGSLL